MFLKWTYCLLTWCHFLNVKKGWISYRSVMGRFFESVLTDWGKICTCDQLDLHQTAQNGTEMWKHVWEVQIYLGRIQQCKELFLVKGQESGYDRTQCQSTSCLHLTPPLDPRKCKCSLTCNQGFSPLIVIQNWDFEA